MEDPVIEATRRLLHERSPFVRALEGWMIADLALEEALEAIGPNLFIGPARDLACPIAALETCIETRLVKAVEAGHIAGDQDIEELTDLYATIVLALVAVTLDGRSADRVHTIRNVASRALRAACAERRDHLNRHA